MKILVITQYFWPENFRINDLVEGLASYDHEVTILTGIPNYPKGKVFPEFLSDPNLFNEFKSSRVIRVPIIPRGKSKLTLALNYLSYAISSIIIGGWKLRGNQFDVIFVYEPSPVTVGLPAIWLKKFKKAPVIFWTLDLWPESLSSFGVVKSKFILSFVGKIVGFIYNRCDLILAQSHSFIEPISKYCKDNVRIEYFPSWSEELPPSNEIASEIEFKNNTFNILFTGNIGQAQDFPSIIEAVECLRNENVRWLIVGDGRMNDWLKDEINNRGLESKILLLGEFPIERMTSFYNHSQALLVSLKRDYFLSLVIPGKVQSYLMSGLPILGMVQGEAEQVIKKSGCGYTCESGNGIALASIVQKMILTSDADRISMGTKGRNFAIQEFDRKMLFKKLESWMFEYAQKKTYWRDTMQSESNSKYTGLEELLTAEKYRNKYNKYIVENCVRQVEKPNTCIDFGAGIGTLSEILKIKLGISPACIEIDEENIKYLNDRNLQNFKNIDDVKGGIDLVFSSNVLEHIKDDVSVLQSIKNKLNRNGYLYLYLPANMLLWSKVDESVGHYRRYSRSEIKQKLMSVGFEIKSVYYADSIGFFAISMMKLVGYDTDKVIESPKSLKIYDNYIFPLSRFFDAIGLKLLFGKNLIVVAKKIN